METRKVPDQKRRAANWYRWLWFSPLLTVPTAVIIGFSTYDLSYGLICPGGYRNCNQELVVRLALIIAILVSALWHLILLFPALEKDRKFVRWHGRQALLLAGVRTAVPLVFVWAYGSGGLIPSILILLVIWLAGAIWGQGQAKRGVCSLALYLGHSDALPPPEPAEEWAALDPRTVTPLETIRYTPDRKQRNKALLELRSTLPPDRDPVALTFMSYELPGQGSELRSRIDAALETIHSNPDKSQREEALKFLETQGLVGDL